MNSDCEEDFEATYEADDEVDNSDGGVEVVVENVVVSPVDRNGKSIVTAIGSYTISRGVDSTIYESKSQTFYAKYKMYDRGCDWKGCWVIWRDNGRHRCTIGTISYDRSKLDSDTIVDAIRPLVKTNPSLKMKSIIAKVQSRFNYTISY
ncbi:hypothetical protein Ahy_B10g106535 [Arachis hypogaea]|uniref:Transposase MuDR plant domain-containing protein n=1 Tax=Arachis hypogaea TaxID=3818 RepID=A0A444XB52_ARAHY|nr:hypothetical protein Ahy_B10g106535 [Arachis hypogaea]